MKTRVTEILGVEHPIIQGGMIYIATAELCAAVSNAGAFGQITSGPSADYCRNEIRRTRTLTDKPFGVNVPLRPGCEEIIKVCIEEKVPVVITSAGNPALYTNALHEGGCKVIHVVPTVRLAKKAESSGVDIVVAEGTEAGGHNGFDEVTTMVLIPQVVDAVKAPVVAAGGIADARGLVAALALGAEGVQMGTRFMATQECIAHARLKEAVVKATDTDTLLTGRKIGPTRVLKNAAMLKGLEMEFQGASNEQLLEFFGEGRSRNALLDGDMEEGSAMCGQIAGMIGSVLTVKEVVDSMINGSLGLRKRLVEI